MKKIFLFGILTLLVLGVVGILFIVNQRPVNQIEEITTNTLFQGPVPEGYDLNYFRETGITKKIGGFE